MSEVILHRRALRYLQRLSKADQARVRTHLSQLGEDPIGHPGLIRMAGEWTGYYRIRIGDLRVIFWYEIEDDIVYVDHIGPRGDVYR